MIIGDIRMTSTEEQAFAPVLREAIHYLRTTDLANMKLGKHAIQDDDLFVLIQNPTTVTQSEQRMEGHEKYIDVQFLIEGEQEIIYVSRKTDDLVISEDLIANKDIAFYDQVGHEFAVTLIPGMFVVLFPSDLHRPVCTLSGGTIIKKAVMKVNKQLLFDSSFSISAPTE
jgi:biofilm protein TabA